MPPIGVVTVRAPKPAINSRALLMVCWTDGRLSDASWQDRQLVRIRVDLLGASQASVDQQQPCPYLPAQRGVAEAAGPILQGGCTPPVRRNGNGGCAWPDCKSRQCAARSWCRVQHPGLAQSSGDQ
jgi:hypothetical protein